MPIKALFLSYCYSKQVLVYKLALLAQQYELLAILILAIPLQQRALFLQDVEKLIIK